MRSRDLAMVEGALASAHRCLNGGIRAASTMADLGLHDDLQLILLELERLQDDLIAGRARRLKLDNFRT